MAIFLVCLLFLSGSYAKLKPVESLETAHPLTTCVTDILQNYYTKAKAVTYVTLDDTEENLLKSINALRTVSVINRTPSERLSRPNRAYMIVAKDVEKFAEHIGSLHKEGHWNPYGRFLIIIRSLEKDYLRLVFDVLLKLHVNNAVILNGTKTAEMYAYNPFENYACGKYYTRIIEFGTCSNVTTNIFPEKIVTGLKNCFFKVSVAHWPPYSINPALVTDGSKYIGTEQYIFKLLSKIEQFKYEFSYDYDPENFSLVTSDMAVSGPLSMLQNNATDVMMGGLILIPSRTQIFYYIYGHLDCIDEVRIMVKKALKTPAWKDFYLEFEPTVWAWLFVILVLYSALVALLLRSEDKGYVVMVLLDNLLSHGSKFRCRQTVNLVFIFWVWFAYLVNSFYTTAMVSLTLSPGSSYQIQDEETITKYGLKSCISSVMHRFRYAESSDIAHVLNKTEVEGCEKLLESINTVSKSDKMFTIVLYNVYSYHRQLYYDEYGTSSVFSFRKPFSKVIYGIYFYKGFPMHERLHMLALRIRETGLSDKSLNDHYYAQSIKYHFRSKGFVSRSSLPWSVYAIGLFLASVSFGIELALHPSKQNGNNEKV